MFESDFVRFGDWAHPFITTPFTSSEVTKSAAMIEYHTEVSATSCGGCRLLRGVSTDSFSGTVTLLAIGRWK